ncbi:MAG: hypothetical protein WCC57_06975, partial [Paracoccaceae bacterium]
GRLWLWGHCLGKECQMTVETIDGIRVLKLKDARLSATWERAGDTQTLVHIWRLLSGGHALQAATTADHHSL